MPPKNTPECIESSRRRVLSARFNNDDQQLSPVNHLPDPRRAREPKLLAAPKTVLNKSDTAVPKKTSNARGTARAPGYSPAAATQSTHRPQGTRPGTVARAEDSLI